MPDVSIKKYLLLLLGVFCVAVLIFIFSVYDTTDDTHNPPEFNVAADSLQGLAAIDNYFEFDASDFDRADNMPIPTARSKEAKYFYTNRDMTMLEIANSIYPDVDLKVKISHFDTLSGDFKTFPRAGMTNNELNAYVISANEGFLITASKAYSTWNINSINQKPNDSLFSLNTAENGWHLFATGEIDDLVDSCANRIVSLQVYNDNKFTEIDLNFPINFENYFMIWVNLVGQPGICNSINSGPVIADECSVDGFITTDTKELCLNGQMIKCDEAVLDFEYSDGFWSCSNAVCRSASGGVASCSRGEWIYGSDSTSYFDCQNGSLSANDMLLCLDGDWLDCETYSSLLYASKYCVAGKWVDYATPKIIVKSPDNISGPAELEDNFVTVIFSGENLIFEGMDKIAIWADDFEGKENVVLSDEIRFDGDRLLIPFDAVAGKKYEIELAEGVVLNGNIPFSGTTWEFEVAGVEAVEE